MGARLPADTQQRFELLQRHWQVVQNDRAAATERTVGAWRAHLGELTKTEQALRAAGRWRSGPKRLMDVLQVAWLEVPHCRVLAWLCDPNAHHGLGHGFVGRFLRAAAGVELGVDDRVEVRREEMRMVDGCRTFADIVIRTPSTTVVVEAKIFAGEQPRQGFRLHSGWVDDAADVQYVFLTPDRRLPATAGGSDQDWTAFSWRELTELLAEALRESEGPANSAGRGAVAEYLKTLEDLHG